MRREDKEKLSVTKTRDPKTKALHNLNGPAIVYKSGRKEYWVNGLKHRLDGPAIVDKTTTGKNWNLWYINGKLATPQIHFWADEVGIDLNNLSDEDITMIHLRWGDYGK